MTPLHLVAVVNGPGEVAGRLFPLAGRLKEVSPVSRVTAVIAPCQFASGRERAVTEGCSAIDTVMTFGAFLRAHWHRNGNGDGSGAARTIVLRLGGGPVFTRILAAALGAPAWCYGTSAAGRTWTDRYLVPHERARAKLTQSGVDPQRVYVVGELVVDSVWSGLANGAGRPGGNGSRREVALMPGSRPFELEFMVPFLIKVASAALARRTGMTFVMPLAPFVERAYVSGLARKAGLALEPEPEGCRLVAPDGTACHLFEGDWTARFRSVDLAVTVPGTNTLQLAALGVPMVVVLPLNKAENIPVEGMLGLMLPSGRLIGLPRRAVIMFGSRLIEYVALPNIIAGETVVPEVRGRLRPEHVAGPMIELLDNGPRLSSMSDRLRDIAGPPGAAARVVAALLDETSPGLSQRTASTTGESACAGGASCRSGW